MTRLIVRLAGMTALVLGGGLLGTPALARCGRDCRTLLRSDYRACRLACGGELTCRMGCRNVRRTSTAVCRAATNPTPPGCGWTGSSSSTTTTTTPPHLTGDFTCTEVLGFSQTGMWFLDVAEGGGGTFQPIVGDAAWQLRGARSAGVDWQDPSFPGWTDPADLYSPCAINSSNPDRVLLTISVPAGIPTLDWWVTNIQAEIATIRAKYSNVREIILQPVVGGPNDGVCEFGNTGVPVHASVIHPTIDQAIAQVVGGDVVAGMSPEVRTCADYADDTGHLCFPDFDSCGTLNARGPIGTLIGDFYANF